MNAKQKIENYIDCHPDQIKGFTFFWSDLMELKNQDKSIDGIGIDLGQDEFEKFAAYAYAKVCKDRWEPNDALAKARVVKGLPCPDWC